MSRPMKVLGSATLIWTSDGQLAAELGLEHLGGAERAAAIVSA